MCWQEKQQHQTVRLHCLAVAVALMLAAVALLGSAEAAQYFQSDISLRPETAQEKAYTISWQRQADSSMCQELCEAMCPCTAASVEQIAAHAHCHTTVCVGN
jgi:hypothetical protein